LELELQKSPINRAMPSFASIVLTQIKPFFDGDTLLWCVTKINNLDKHNRIALVSGITKINISSLVTDSGGGLKNVSFIVNNGVVLTPLIWDAPFRIDGKVTAELSVKFGPNPDLHYLENKEILSTLKSMVVATSSALDSLEQEFLLQH
jgi:hypothetical protein